MRTLFNFSVFTSAAMLAATLGAVPAAAKDRGALQETGAPDPMTIIVSLRNQKAHIYRGMSLITTTSVSTGKPGHATKAGVYSILEKRRRHYSNLYNGAPMPFMQRLTWTGTALHAGVVPGYPASHGCIRLPRSFAPKLFKMTQVGAQVVVANSTVAPKPISHPALFQPLPPPMPPSMAGLMSKDEARGEQNDAPKSVPLRKSSLDPGLGKTMRSPVILAKAGAAPVKPIRLGSVDAPASQLEQATGSISRDREALGEVKIASLEDTNTHAINPSAAPSSISGSMSGSMSGKFAHIGDGGEEGAGLQAIGRDPVLASPETTGDISKHTDRLKHQEQLKRENQLKHEARLVQPAETLGETRAPESVAKPRLSKAAALGGPAAHHVGAILNVSANPIAARAPQPLAVSLSVLGVNDHPPVPLSRPSVMMSKLTDGAANAAVQAAEPISPEPLRILVTRRTTRDRTVDIQYMLSDMGYLAPQNFDGTRGTATVRALKAFQKDNEMPVTGAFTDDVTDKIYQVAGKKKPPEGQLFVRQKFASVFSVPVRFSNPDKPLGTHLFTAMHFAPGATEADWTAISLNDKESASTVLDRIEIPEDVRLKISERLTPGSSLIVADTAINSAALPKGADFLVWDTSKKPKVHYAKPKRRATRRRTASSRQRARPSYQRQRYSRRSPPRRSYFPF